MAPRAPITAPTPRPPSYGLLVVAPTTTGDAERWPLGFTFEPMQCAASGKLAVECIGNTAAMSGVVDEDASPVVDGEPFLVVAGYQCSPFGFQARDWDGIVRAQLRAVRSFEVADQLWSDTLGLAAEDGTPFRPLNSLASDRVTGSAATITDALACVEQALGACLRGARGMVHMMPQLLVHAAAQQAVHREGNLWVTPMGNVVVADAGYDGSGPGGLAAGDTQFIYGTSMVEVRLSAEAVTPDPDNPDAEGFAGLERDQNTVEVFAYQLAGIVWDRCCHVAAEVDEPVCAIGGAS